MSTLQSAHNSQSVPEGNSQPSSTPELQSNTDNTQTSSQCHDEPDVVIISDEKEDKDKDLKKGKSEIWKHFDKVRIDNCIKAVCKYCGAKLKGDSKSGTSHLHSHYNTKHHTRGQTSIRQKLLSSNFNKDHPELASLTFNAEGAKKELAKMIIMHEYPISIVDHVGFKRYSSYLQPLFKVPCRNTIKNEIFRIYDVERAKTLSLLEGNASRVAITTDMWTASNQKKGYMAVTSHFIDASWILQSRIMRFIYVPCPHTKEVLCDNLLECLMDWNLDRKLSCLTVDNCTTNDAMIENLLEKLDCSSLIAGGSLFHMRCAAHILNLIVKDGLDVIKVGVEKIRGQRELQYKNSDLCPSREEWEFAQDMCSRLKKFFKATEIFSGTKYPTANQCFINICEIRLAILDWRKNSELMIQTMAEKMLIKFEKYWDVMHGVVGVAAVLDPRYKMEVLEFYFEKLFGEASSFKVYEVRDLCYSLLKECHEKRIRGVEGAGDSTSAHTLSTSENVSEYDLFISTKKRKRVDSIKSELDHYLDEDVVQKSDGFDLLNWWKVNELKYPNLQRLARDFLAVPASTVASESAFSSSGRLVSPHRNRLHPKTLEALMCAQSWLWAAEMPGEASVGYATIYNDHESEDSCITREV